MQKKKEVKRTLHGALPKEEAKNVKLNEDAVTEAPKEEMVSVSKSMLEKMQEDISNLKKGELIAEFDPDAPKEILVDIRLYKGKPVIDVGSVYYVKDERGVKIEWISFTVLGMEDPVSILYEEFRLELEKVNVKVVNVEKEPTKLHQNKEYVYKKKVEGHKSTAVGDRVPTMVRSQIVTYDVELKNGSVVQLTQEAIN